MKWSLLLLPKWNFKRHLPETLYTVNISVNVTWFIKVSVHLKIEIKTYLRAKVFYILMIPQLNNIAVND